MGKSVDEAIEEGFPREKKISPELVLEKHISVHSIGLGDDAPAHALL